MKSKILLTWFLFDQTFITTEDNFTMEYWIPSGIVYILFGNIQNLLLKFCLSCPLSNFIFVSSSSG